MTEQEKKITSTVEKCNNQLKSFPNIKQYLNDRLISDDLIDEFKLGYGEFYGNRWVTIPIQHPQGHYSAIKFRKDPFINNEKNKFKMYPMGHGVTIFGLKNLFDENLQPINDLDIVLSEGELDSILLSSMGIPAITTTGGAGTFREEWIDLLQNCRRITIIYDLDEPGKNGAKKVSDMILKKYPKKEVFNTTLPEDLGKGGDVTDFCKKYGKNVDMLLYELTERSKRPIVKQSQYNDVLKPSSSGYGNGDISRADIDMAASADCEKFVKVVRRSYDTSWAHCPFGCKDNSPSFCCYKGDRGWYAFCHGEGNNTIALVQKLYNLDFKEAVKFINNKK